MQRKEIFLCFFHNHVPTFYLFIYYFLSFFSYKKKTRYKNQFRKMLNLKNRLKDNSLNNHTFTNTFCHQSNNFNYTIVNPNTINNGNVTPNANYSMILNGSVSRVGDSPRLRLVKHNPSLSYSPKRGTTTANHLRSNRLLTSEPSNTRFFPSTSSSSTKSTSSRVVFKKSSNSNKSSTSSTLLSPRLNADHSKHELTSIAINSNHHHHQAANKKNGIDDKKRTVRMRKCKLRKENNSDNCVIVETGNNELSDRREISVFERKNSFTI